MSAQRLAVKMNYKMAPSYGFHQATILKRSI
jgi:hypothetical protein